MMAKAKETKIEEVKAEEAVAEVKAEEAAKEPEAPKAEPTLAIPGTSCKWVVLLSLALTACCMQTSNAALVAT